MLKSNLPYFSIKSALLKTLICGNSILNMAFRAVKQTATNLEGSEQ